MLYRNAQNVRVNSSLVLFLTPKPDGSSRFILNLKKLNKYIATEHFKLEDIRTARDLMEPNCFMASLDLKDAYYLIPIAECSKKYLRFRFNNSIYEFNCLPFRLNTAPYVFTKVMCPVIILLRSYGYTSVIYLDDILFIENTEQKCKESVQQTIYLLEKLGFIINKNKSQLKATQKIKFLGFILNSTEMKIQLPDDKKKNMLRLSHKFTVNNQYKIREFASLIGSLRSCCLAAKYGWVYMKDLEREKFLSLKKYADDFEAFMTLSPDVLEDLTWWKTNISHIYNPINSPRFVTEIFSDASLTGWGAVCGENSTHGHWKPREQNYHINYLKIKAAFFALKCFAQDLKNCDVLLHIDNTTALAYINRMGGIQFKKLSKISKEIWK